MPKWTSTIWNKSLAICKWEQEYNLQGRTASGAPLYKAFDSKLCLFTQMEPNSTSWDWTKTLQEMAKNERNGMADLATGVFFSYIPKVWVWSWFHFASSHNQCNSICLYLFGYKRNVFVLDLTFQCPLDRNGRVFSPPRHIYFDPSCDGSTSDSRSEKVLVKGHSNYLACIFLGIASHWASMYCMFPEFTRFWCTLWPGGSSIP